MNQPGLRAVFTLYRIQDRFHTGQSYVGTKENLSRNEKLRNKLQ